MSTLVSEESIFSCMKSCNACPNKASAWEKSQSISRLSNGGAQDNLSKNFIDNIKLVIPPIEFIKRLNLSALIEQMTFNYKEIIVLLELQTVILAQMSSR